MVYIFIYLMRCRAGCALGTVLNQTLKDLATKQPKSFASLGSALKTVSQMQGFADNSLPHELSALVDDSHMLSHVVDQLSEATRASLVTQCRKAGPISIDLTVADLQLLLQDKQLFYKLMTELLAEDSSAYSSISAALKVGQLSSPLASVGEMKLHDKLKNDLESLIANKETLVSIIASLPPSTRTCSFY